MNMIERVDGPTVFPRIVTLIVAGLFILSCGNSITGGPEIDSVEERVSESWVGDLDGLKERGYVRVLVTPSRTDYFIDRRDLRGFAVEWITAFEKQLNSDRKASEKLRIVWEARSFGDLLPALKAGEGDIAIGGLTVLETRRNGVEFSDPYLSGVDEVIVHHKKVGGLKELDDLSGRSITIRSSTSYEAHLDEIGRGFRRRGLDPPKVRAIGSFLVTEDILEMVNAGIIDLTVADRHLAEAWAQVMPNLVVRPDIVVSGGGALAVAVRTGNPQLLAAVNQFVKANKKGTLLGNVLFTRYYKDIKWLQNPSDYSKGPFQNELVDLFQEYAGRYDFRWVNIAAQAFRESRFDNNMRSRAGAVGIMQIKPSTAADSNVGITAVEDLENNIHAGVKYLAFVRDRYFTEQQISEDEQLNFALAAYNAGPRRIVAARRDAPASGLDPDRWFNNVELVVAKTVGREPVDYVRDIRAYSIAFEMSYQQYLKRQLDRESVKQSP